MLQQKLLNLSRTAKRLIQVFADIVLVLFSLWLAFFVRLGWDKSLTEITKLPLLWVVAPVIAILVFIPMGMYRAVIRYFGKEALLTIAKAITTSALLLALFVYWYQGSINVVIPRSIVFNYWVASILTMGGLRLAMRYYFMGGWISLGKTLLPFHKDTSHLPRVAIYGAGAAGNQLLAALRLGSTMLPVAFIDDDPKLNKGSIGGLRVYDGRHTEQMIKETEATQILLALPSVSRARRREIIAGLEPYPLHVRTIPGFMDLASGRVKVQDVQEVDIADLLGRDAVAPKKELFERCIKDQAVMVTGAGGSIGSELCRQILLVNPTALILYEHSEFNLYAIHKELVSFIEHQKLQTRLLPILGSVRNFKRLRMVMRNYNIDTLYHAAAYKHVPIVEHNTVEGILNNTMGTLYSAEAAIVCGVKNFVLISTDKAVRPTNIMGSTKRLAEMVLQALSKEAQVRLFSDNTKIVANKTRFTMVRFGNVLDSSGSVIPLFREQIKSGGPITVTHPNITRYFMTIPEAAQLVIQAGSMGHGGDVFVLDMGEPVKIAELAEKMILLTGLTVRSPENPKGDIAIEYIGLRPGEKLYEELLIGENVTSTEHPAILRANEKMLAWNAMCTVLQNLKALVDSGNLAAIRQTLKDVIDGYTPQGEIVDWMYKVAKD